jgi:hypothetical protein
VPFAWGLAYALALALGFPFPFAIGLGFDLDFDLSGFDFGDGLGFYFVLEVVSDVFDFFLREGSISFVSSRLRFLLLIYIWLVYF